MLVMELAVLLLKEEVDNIVGAAMEVHSVLGPGLLEPVYQESLAIEFSLRGIPFIEQPQLSIEYKGQQLKRKYVPYFLCYEEIIVEAKALSPCGANEEAQIINAIKTANKKVGVFINFGEPSLYWRKYIN